MNSECKRASCGRVRKKAASRLENFSNTPVKYSPPPSPFFVWKEIAERSIRNASKSILKISTFTKLEGSKLGKVSNSKFEVSISSKFRNYHDSKKKIISTNIHILPISLPQFQSSDVSFIKKTCFENKIFRKLIFSNSIHNYSPSKKKKRDTIKTNTHEK